MKTKEEILEKWYQEYRNSTTLSRFEAGINAMQELEDQFKAEQESDAIDLIEYIENNTVHKYCITDSEVLRKRKDETYWHAKEQKWVYAKELFSLYKQHKQSVIL